MKARHEVLTLTGHGSVTWSPDGKGIVTASGDRTAKVWDAKTGQELLTLIGHDQEVASVVRSPDGRQILTASHDRTAKVWDAMVGQGIDQKLAPELTQYY